MSEKKVPGLRGEDLSMEQARVLPNDELNRALVANVHPPNWANPTPAGRYNLVVIGAGTAGLVTAAGAAGLGARETHTAAGALGAAGEHGLGTVEAERVGRREVLVQPPGQLAGAAAEIDDAHRRPRSDEGDQVEPGLQSLGGEAVVLIGIPGAGHGRPTNGRGKNV